MSLAVRRIDIAVKPPVSEHALRLAAPATILSAAWVNWCTVRVWVAEWQGLDDRDHIVRKLLVVETDDKWSAPSSVSEEHQRLIDWGRVWVVEERLPEGHYGRTRSYVVFTLYNDGRNK